MTNSVPWSHKVNDYMQIRIYNSEINLVLKGGRLIRRASMS